MSQQENKPISPRNQYMIPGASLLSVMDILESEIPCKYIHVLDRIGTLLSGVKELEIKSPSRESDPQAGVGDPEHMDFPPPRG